MGILLEGVSGLTGIKAQVVGVSDGYVWDGSQMADPTGLTDAEILAGMVACTELTSGDGTGLGKYAPSPTWPAGLATSAEYAVFFYNSPSGPDDSSIGYQEDPTNYIAAQVADIYHADVEFTIDEANAQDEYTVIWFKNGLQVSSGITTPEIQVVKRADGTDLIAATAMTEVGATGVLKYDEATNRTTAGESVEVKVTATIDGATRTWVDVVSRDSA